MLPRACQFVRILVFVILTRDSCSFQVEFGNETASLIKRKRGKATAFYPPFINGSRVLYPKCNVVKCAHSPQSTKTSQPLSKRTDDISDRLFTDPGVRQRYIREVNRWYLRTITEDGQTSSWNLLELPLGVEPAFHVLDTGTQYAPYILGYNVHPWILYQWINNNIYNNMFGMDHATMLVLDHSLADIWPYELDQRILDVLVGPQNLVAADEGVVMARTQGFQAGRIISWIEVGIMELSQLIDVEINIFAERYYTIVDQLATVLDQLFNSVDRSVGQSFRVFADILHHDYLEALNDAYMLQLYSHWRGPDPREVADTPQILPSPDTTPSPPPLSRSGPSHRLPPGVPANGFNNSEMPLHNANNIDLYNEHETPTEWIGHLYFYT